MRKISIFNRPFYCTAFGSQVAVTEHPTKQGLLVGDDGEHKYELVPQAFSGFANKHVAFTAFRKGEATPIFELPSYTPRTPYIFAPSTRRSYKYVRELKQNVYEYVCVDPSYDDKLAVSPYGTLFVGSDRTKRVHRIPFNLIAAILGIPLIGNYSTLWRDDWNPFLHRGGVCLYAGAFQTLATMCAQRTQSRIAQGVYYSVPPKFPVAPETGVHLSTLDDKLLAYYPTNAHILNDRPQRIKPGRYIKKYFPHISDDRIRELSAHIGNSELVFYSKGEDMIDAYMELANSGVVSSCMSKRNWDPHPLMVYDNSDVELAVLRVNGEAVARALYNKHTREYPMVYGQWERMRVALDKAGFKHGVLDGAHINVIRVGASYRMPYIDGHRNLNRSMNNSTRVSPDNETTTWVIDADGDFSANSHDVALIARGYSFVGDVNYVDDRVYHECACCGELVDDSDANYIEYDEVYVHPSCDDLHRVYTRRGEMSCLSVRDFIEIDGEYYEDGYAAEYYDYRYSNYHQEWIHLENTVWVDDANDWYHHDDEGEIFTYIQCSDAVLVKNLDVTNLYVAKNSNGEAEMISSDDDNQPVIEYYEAGGKCPAYVHTKVWSYIESQILTIRDPQTWVAA